MKFFVMTFLSVALFTSLHAEDSTWDKTKETSHEAWDATKDGSEKTWHKTGR